MSLISAFTLPKLCLRITALAFTCAATMPASAQGMLDEPSFFDSPLIERETLSMPQTSPSETPDSDTAQEDVPRVTSPETTEETAKETNQETRAQTPIDTFGDLDLETLFGDRGESFTPDLGNETGRIQTTMEDMPYVKLRSLDKITARTVTFEARVGSTVKFGPLYIKTQACRKAPPIAQPESASFLQIWEMVPAPETAADKQQEPVPQWVFSGWMFASSPALSAMDHPIYDVWVLDCLEKSQLPPTQTSGQTDDNAQTSNVVAETMAEAQEEAQEEALEEAQEEAKKEADNVDAAPLQPAADNPAPQTSPIFP
jgi:hypothetical protein